jgi:hypothetical protein
MALDLSTSKDEVKMKTLLVLFIVLYFYSSIIRGDDSDYGCCPCEYQANEDSWDLKPLNPYSDTVIVTDPYGQE